MSETKKGKKREGVGVIIPLTLKASIEGLTKDTMPLSTPFSKRLLSVLSTRVSSSVPTVVTKEIIPPHMISVAKRFCIGSNPKIHYMTDMEAMEGLIQKVKEGVDKRGVQEPTNGKVTDGVLEAAGIK